MILEREAMICEVIFEPLSSIYLPSSCELLAICWPVLGSSGF